MRPVLWDVHLVVSRNLFKSGGARNPTCFEPTDFMHVNSDTHVTEYVQHLEDGCKCHWLFRVVKRLDNVLCEFLIITLFKDYYSHLSHPFVFMLFSVTTATSRLSHMRCQRLVTGPVTSYTTSSSPKGQGFYFNCIVVVIWVSAFVVAL